MIESAARRVRFNEILLFGQGILERDRSEVSSW